MSTTATWRKVASSTTNTLSAEDGCQTFMSNDPQLSYATYISISLALRIITNVIYDVL